MTLVRKLTRALVSTTVIASSIHPQPGPAKPTPASLAGLSYAYGDWSTAMPNDPGLVLLCYRLVPTNSASQPFTLEPTDFPETDGDSRIGASWEKKKRSPCTVLDAKHPLLERGILAVAIDSRAGGDSTPISRPWLSCTSTSRLKPAVHGIHRRSDRASARGALHLRTRDR